MVTVLLAAVALVVGAVVNVAQMVAARTATAPAMPMAMTTLAMVKVAVICFTARTLVLIRTSPPCGGH